MYDALPVSLDALERAGLVSPELLRLRMEGQVDVHEQVSSSDSSLELDGRDFTITSDYDPSIDGSSEVGSVTSSIYAHIHEHGSAHILHARPRYTFADSGLNIYVTDVIYGRYPIPNDENEEGRESLRHSMALTLLKGKLFLAPIGDNPQRIVDLGTGFGQWAIEMGDAFPSAQVTGIDLSPVQPVWVPPNVNFVVDDIEEDAWGRDGIFDYVHLRVTASVLRDPIKVAATAFDKLKPGGWIEFQEIYPKVSCDDGSMPDDFPLIELYDLIERLLARHSGFQIYVAEQLPHELERLGYVNIQRRVFNIPVGTWAMSRRLSRAGYLFRVVVAELVPVLAAKAEQMGIPCEEVEGLSCRVLDSMHADQPTNVHAYVPFHFIWAQKPEL
ncbi:hypothetical protein PpBr36_01065 [Pyricularia pennisetigena]|uniref:hypothetical protein n=1 Tax=Pyricularia pennisetigena TaxID=1578925 RepID=UPI001153B6FB|nr:hypothetical protein PpBr36_01065 [Pyricularia pennisetigena]TLS28677.1 hypothetical protein PpBr36_01065 [Pyricularia pennisetigena]